MSLPNIEDVAQLCRDHGWTGVGNDHDLLYWLGLQMQGVEHAVERAAYLEVELDAALDAQQQAKEQIKSLEADVAEATKVTASLANLLAKQAKQ